MYHSIYIEGINTWVDWHLIPSTRPVVNPPKVRTTYVEIPGGDGSLDLTESLIGQPSFQSRTGSWEFFVDNTYENNWSELFSKIMRSIHGKKSRIILEDDPKYYYEGRLSVNSWRSNKDFARVVIDYVVSPYKKIRWRNNNDWSDLFDISKDKVVNANLSSFHSVENGLTFPVYTAADESLTVWSSMPTGDITMSFNGVSYPLKYAKNIFDDLHFIEGENVLQFSSRWNSGHVKVHVIGGCL